MYDLHPNTRRRLCPVAIGLLTASLLTTIAAALESADVPYRIGLVVVIGAATALVSLRTGVNARVLEKARQHGYDAGYAEGRRAPRPVVVPLPGLETPSRFGEHFISRGSSEHSPQSV